MKDIIFSPIEEKVREWAIDPKPSIYCIPEWHKDMPSSYENISLKRGGWKTPTIKRCMPFMDSLSAGYTFFLSSDIYVSQEEGGIRFEWNAGEIDFVTSHVPEQVAGLPTGDYSLLPAKWINFYKISTPRGYSSFIVHPLNRIDLPFHTLSGTVDTDSHPIAINFPFFIKKNFQGVIERGTPIAQIIPFKRDSWKMRIGNSVSNHKEKHYYVQTKLYNSYKNRFWQKKNYR